MKKVMLAIVLSCLAGVAIADSAPIKVAVQMTEAQMAKVSAGNAFGAEVLTSGTGAIVDSRSGITTSIESGGNNVFGLKSGAPRSATCTGVLCSPP